MYTDQRPDVRVFKARATNGMQFYYWMVAAFMSAALVVWLISTLFNFPGFVPILTLSLMVFFSLLWLTIGYISHRIANGVRYEVSAAAVTMLGGPVRYTVPLDSIKRVYEFDVGSGLITKNPRVSVVRLPNLSLAYNEYRDIGAVKMCATSLQGGITIIETDSGKYGVTPEDEEGFKAAIGQR